MTRAFKMAGKFDCSNWTSTMAPMTALTLPTATGVAAAEVAMDLFSRVFEEVAAAVYSFDTTMI